MYLNRLTELYLPSGLVLRRILSSVGAFTVSLYLIKGNLQNYRNIIYKNIDLREGRKFMYAPLRCLDDEDARELQSYISIFSTTIHASLMLNFHIFFCLDVKPFHVLLDRIFLDPCNSN